MRGSRATIPSNKARPKAHGQMFGVPQAPLFTGEIAQDVLTEPQISVTERRALSRLGLESLATTKAWSEGKSISCVVFPPGEAAISRVRLAFGAELKSETGRMEAASWI